MARLDRIRNILGGINPLDSEVRQDFGKAFHNEYGVGGEEQRQAQYKAREKKKLGPDAPKMEQMLGAYRLPQVIKKAVMGDRKLPQGAPQFLKDKLEVDPAYEAGRAAANVPIVMNNPAQKAGRLVGAVAGDLTQDATRRFWWLLNAAQAVGEIGAEGALKMGNKDLYAQVGEGRDKKRKYRAGDVQALAIPAGIAINTGLGLMTPFGGAEGYKAALPSEEDPTKTSNVVGEVGAKYFLGRTGNLLPYDEFVKVRPDVSKDEYGRYKAFKHDKRGDLNPFDDGKMTVPTGVLKYTSEGIHGPEVQFLGKGLPVTTGIVPYLASIAGGVAGVRSKRPITGGLVGGLAGLAAGQVGGSIIENERRRRNTVENELDGTLS
jgi:hypothetical protein